MKNKAILFILFAFAACGVAQAQSDNSVEVVYNGTSATVTVADNISQYLTVTQQGAHVSIAQSDSVASEITYTLSGSSTDGINSAQDLTISGGYVYSRSNNNDGIDANGSVYLNGGLVYAIGSGGAENAIDANSVEGKKFYVNGGVLIAVGGVENGATYNQPKIQQSSVSSNTWYTITYGDNVVAFKTPTIRFGLRSASHRG